MDRVNLQVVDFGPNNSGKYGPDGIADMQKLEEDVRNGEHRLPATNRWICVDGRTPLVPRANTRHTGEIDPQIPGGPAVTDSAADLMDPATVGVVRLSERLAANTKTHVNRGNTVVAHGDNHKGRGGCAAGAIEDNLRYGAENVDVIAPIVWGVSQMYGLDRHGVTEQDVNNSLLTGGKNANDDNVIDVKSMDERVQIQLDNGAEYEELLDDHNERFGAIELEANKAFDNQGFAEDHVRPDGTRDEAFGVALGKYIHDSVGALVAEGRTPHDACLHVMRVIAYTVSLTKRIGNEDLQAWLLGKARPVEILGTAAMSAS